MSSLYQKLLTAEEVCSDCGKKYGKYSVGCSSMWLGTCDVCGQTKEVTEVRDWGYLTKGINELKPRRPAEPFSNLTKDFTPERKAKIKEQSKEVAEYMKSQEPILTESHTITPPPELVRQWALQATQALPEDERIKTDIVRDRMIANRAAQWGADAELEACCEWVDWKWSGIKSRELRASRRLKPPSLKEQALDALNEIEDKMQGPTIQEKLIRRALEQLPD